QPPPGGGPRRQLGAFLADVPADGATTGRIQRPAGCQEPPAGAPQAADQPPAGGGAGQVVGGQNGDGGRNPQAEADHRAGGGQGQGAQGMHAEQVAAVGAADTQDRLLTSEGAGQDAARIGRQERGHEGSREAEEQQHALGDTGV